MTIVQFLKRVRKGITPEKNFCGANGMSERPHCLMGEWDLQALKMKNYPYRDCYLSNYDIELYCSTKITHSQALSILDRAIKREEKKATQTKGTQHDKSK